MKNSLNPTTDRRPATKEDYVKRAELQEKAPDSQELFQLLDAVDWFTKGFEENGKYGLKNALGEVIVPARYDDFLLPSTQELKAGQLVTAYKENLAGILEIGSEEKWYVTPQFDYMGLPNHLCSVRKDGKYGIYDIVAGKFIVDAVCEQVETLPGIVISHFIGIFKIDGLYGIIDGSMDKTEAIFEEIGFDDDGPVEVKFKGEWGYIDENGTFTKDLEQCHFFYTMDF